MERKSAIRALSYLRPFQCHPRGAVSDGGFILDGLNAESYDRERSNRELLIRIVSYFRPARWSMLLVAVMIVAGAVVDAVLPIMTSRGVDALGGNRGDGQIRLIVVAILVAGALSWTCNFIRLRGPVADRLQQWIQP